MEDTIQMDNTITELITQVAAVPARLARAVAGRTAAELRAASGDAGWSAGEILAHLRASDDIFSPRAYAILVRDNPPLIAYDERVWAEVAGYAEADFAESLAVFAGRRAELVRLLRRAAPEAWQRIGVHEVAGPLTLAAVITRLAEHEDEHCRQLETLWSPAHV